MKQIILLSMALIPSLFVSAQDDSNDSIASRKELQELVVKATKPISKFESDGIVTTVAGTPLQSLGNAADVLGYMPGVLNNNGSIEVVGKGQPVIYINGRKILNQSELSQLSASLVKNIKVISNPGARYSGSTNAVIKISTVREVGDGFSLQSRTTIGVNNYAYGSELVSLNYRKSGLDVFSTLQYDNNRSKGSNVVTQNLFGNNQYTSILNRKSHKKSQLYSGKIGFNYVTKNGHTFGAYYQNDYNPDKNNILSGSDNFLNDELQSQYSVLNNTRDKDKEHLVDGYYTGNWGKWTADFSFNMLWKNAENRQNINETIIDITTNDLNLHDNSHGRMIAGKLDVSRQLWAGTIELGAEYTNSSRNDVFTSDALAISSDENQSKESNLGVYAQLMQRVGRVLFQVGLRYENINSEYFEYGNKIAEQSRNYNELLPSVNLIIPLSTTSFQFGYARKYTSPLYSQLSSTVHYVNQNNYEKGNPYLKNSFIDNLSLNFRYKWLTLMASYKHTNNKIITACEEYDGNPDVTLIVKENSKRAINSFEFIASAMPGFIGKCYYPVIMAGAIAQFYEIDYRNQIRNMNSPLALVRLNNIFKLPNNYMLYANLSYKSSFEGENVHMMRSWQFDISAAKTFNQHWNLRLSINDIFNTGRKGGFTIYSGLRDFTNIRYNTLRGVELTVQYQFNTAESKYKGKGAGQSEKERL
jgi:hypothetical protein